ncbi:MAG TPA: TetR/AcrR family transcriptional regulator [Rubrobacteraceae bacterium]|nr:TetR/AcrR family transcriptional regulator [Rubrobacteraceae bacterium]
MEKFSVKDAAGGERSFPVLGAEACGAAGCEERRDAAESRRRILDAARTLFSDRGVEAVSMYEIGREAGVGQGTLYRRYEHKGALCMALLRESIEHFAEEVRSRLENDDEPALEQLEYLLARLTRFNEENAPLLGAIRDAAGGARRFGVYRNPFYRWLRTTVIVLLERGVGGGEVPADLDVEYLSDAILAPMNIDLYLFQRQELHMEPVRITSSLWALISDGLRGRR